MAGKGSSRPIISGVVDLQPKRLPLLSLACVRKLSGHQILQANHRSSSWLKLIEATPLSLGSGMATSLPPTLAIRAPAASDVKTILCRVGAAGLVAMGRPLAAVIITLTWMAMSAFTCSGTGMISWPSGSKLATKSLVGFLNPFRNGQRRVTSITSPMATCSWFRLAQPPLMMASRLSMVSWAFYKG